MAAAAYDANIGGLQQIATRESVLDILTSDVAEEPSVQELTREAIVTMANAPTRVIAFWVFAVQVLALKKGAASTEGLRQAIQNARHEIENYIVGGPGNATRTTDN